MKPLTASEFWSLPKDERSARIDEGFNSGCCSACGKPILDGEPRNGLHGSHYDCTELGPPPTEEEFGQLVKKIDDGLRALHHLKNRGPRG